MNEQVKKLLNDAGLDIRHNGIVLTKNITGGEALEKFAELIVRECVSIAETAEPYQSADLIKKHFGVDG